MDKIKRFEEKKETKIDREVKFVDWWYSGNKGAPTYADAIEWARGKALFEVLNWLSFNMTSTTYIDMQGKVLDKPSFLRRMREAMEDKEDNETTDY